MANLYQGNYYNNLNKVNVYNILVQNPNFYSSPQIKQQYINNQAISPFLLEQQNIRFNSPTQNQYRIINQNINPNINPNIYQTSTAEFNYNQESRVPRFYYKHTAQNFIIPNNYLNNNAQVIKIQRSNTANFAPRMTTVPKIRQNYYYNVFNNNIKPVEVKMAPTNVRYNSLNQINNNININNNIKNVRIITNEQIIKNDTQNNNPLMNGIQSIKAIKTKKGKKKTKKIPKVSKVTKLTNENIPENNSQIKSQKVEKQISNDNNLLTSNEQINNRNRFAFSAHFPSSLKLKQNNIIETNNNHMNNNNNKMNNNNN